MPRVICTICGEPGYTAASPPQVQCECGGKLEVLPDVPRKNKTKNEKDNLEDECLISKEVYLNPIR
jgi:hypothetical protein